MKKNTKNRKIEVMSITSDNKMINQETLTIQEHEADNYLLLSDNRFGDNAVLAPGYFNRKTKFVLGKTNSILSSDENLNITTIDTDKLINSDRFLLYPIPCFTLEQNRTIDYKSLNNEVSTIEFSQAFGYDIGKFLFIQDFSILKEYNQDFLRLFLDIKRGFSLNKNVIINSNPWFIINIIKGYFEASGERGIYLLPNVNIYTFSTMLNYIGASYSIRNSKNNTKKVYIQLQPIFKDFMLSKFIKPERYVWDNDIKKLILKSGDVTCPQRGDITDKINNDHVIVIPCKSLHFERIESVRIFDLTAERHDATNYAVPFTPFLKNSDGDILAVSGVFTKEGLEDSMEFSPERKTYYKDINSGSINQWIADDAILGLYNISSKI